MARTDEVKAAPTSGPSSWWMQGADEEPRAHTGPHVSPQQVEKTHKWWQVMCLTVVDYFPLSATNRASPPSQRARFHR